MPYSLVNSLDKLNPIFVSAFLLTANPLTLMSTSCNYLKDKWLMCDDQYNPYSKFVAPAYSTTVVVWSMSIVS